MKFMSDLFILTYCGGRSEVHETF